MRQQMLVVDESAEVSAREQAAWEKHGITTVRVDTMQEAIELLQRRDFFFIAINADTIDYRPLLGEMRRVSSLFILIITSAFTVQDQTEALQLGANGYAPFQENVEDNVESALAIIRRYTEQGKQSASQSPVLVHGNLVVSTVSRKAYIDKMEVSLTTREFDLLLLLMERPGRVYTYDMIYERVWGASHSHDVKNILWTAIRRLRDKLSADPAAPQYIKTVRNVGYSFDPGD